MDGIGRRDRTCGLVGRESVSYTIGHLARAAGVGVETIRYYQRRRLLPVPKSQGSVRRYPADLIARIRFIKRSQALGFNLEEIRLLLRLERGGTRHEIRRLAESRLGAIRGKITGLQRMEKVLAQVLDDCRHSSATAPCPIIAALNADRDTPAAGATAAGAALDGTPSATAQTSPLQAGTSPQR